MATALGERAATEALASATPVTVSDQMESDVPTIDTVGYQRSTPRRKKSRDCYEGTEAIRTGGEAYIPRFRGESTSGYNARRTIAGFFNAYGKTIDASTGLVVEPEPVLGEDMPDVLKTMAESVDGAGTHLAVFSRHLVTWGLIDGYVGIITEYSRVSESDLSRPGVSQAAVVALAEGREFDDADVKALGLRPYFILVKADEVLPVYETVSGKRTLVQLIRRWTSTVRKGRFGRKTLTHYDVYELIGGLVMHERWTTDADGGTPKRDGVPIPLRNLTGIPWSPLATGKKKGEDEYIPPLMDLADLNITHHRINSGRLSLQEEAFVPTMVRVGAPQNEKGEYPEILTGSAEVIEVPATVGVPNPVYYVSPPVEVLAPSKESLDDTARQMATMGAAFIAPESKSDKTATESRMDAAGESATLGNTSRAFKDCLESAFGWAGQYVRQPGGSVTVNTDFIGLGVDVQILTALLANYQSDRPIVEIEDVRHYLKTGQLPEGFDPDNVLGLLTLTAKFASDKANALADALANADAQGDGAAV